MKKMHFIIAVMLSVLAGCSNVSTDDKEAIRVATAYKEIEYNVDDYTKITFPESYLAKGDEIKPFMTDEGYVGSMQSREPGFPLQIAQSEQSTIHAEHIHIESAQDEENGVMSLTYNLVLVLRNDQGTSKEIKIAGVLTMVKVNEEWKIKYDNNHNLKDLSNLANKRG